MKSNKVVKPLRGLRWILTLLMFAIIFALGGCSGDNANKDQLSVGGGAGSAIETPIKNNETPVETPIVAIPIETPKEQIETVQETPVINLPTAITKDLKVHFIDVGQADSIFIELPNGQTMLIDAGEAGNADQVLSYIRSLNYTKLDYVVATHPHADHIGGFYKVINGIAIGKFYLPNKEHTTKTFESMIDALTAKEVDTNAAEAGVDILNIDGLRIQILSPGGSYGDDLNNWSAVVQINYKENKFLFMGDAESKVENQLSNVDVDVLKVGHHGSDTSSSLSFLSKTTPSFAIISVGAGNSYGHPVQSTLDNLSSVGAKIYRTDLLGTIIISSDGKTIKSNKSPQSAVAQNPKPTPTPVPAPTPTPTPTPAPTTPIVDPTIGTTVYVTATGTKYHRDGCRYLEKSKIPLSLEKAKQGYTPCKVCNPPT